MNRKEHWQRVFSTKGEQDVSWFEALPALAPAVFAPLTVLRGAKRQRQFADAQGVLAVEMECAGLYALFPPMMQQSLDVYVGERVHAHS